MGIARRENAPQIRLWLHTEGRALRGGRAAEELTEVLPFAPIVSLLMKLDKRTGYLDCFTRASGQPA